MSAASIPRSTMPFEATSAGRREAARTQAPGDRAFELPEKPERRQEMASDASEVPARNRPASDPGPAPKPDSEASEAADETEGETDAAAPLFMAQMDGAQAGAKEPAETDAASKAGTEPGAGPVAKPDLALLLPAVLAAGDGKAASAEGANSAGASAAGAKAIGLVAAKGKLADETGDKKPEAKAETGSQPGQAAGAKSAGKAAEAGASAPAAAAAESGATETAQSAVPTPVAVNAGQLLQAPRGQPELAAAAQTGQAPAGSAADAGRPTPLHVLPVEIGMRALAGNKRFDIRLDPGELGRVDVRLEISDDGGVSARLTVDRVETLHLLQRDARTLERAFEQAGLKSSDGSVEITLRDPSDQSGARQGRQEDGGGATSRSIWAATADDTAMSAEIAPMRRAVRLGGVDLSI